MIDLRDNPVAYIDVNLNRETLALFLNGNQDVVDMVNNSWQHGINDLCSKYFPDVIVKITPHEGYDVRDMYKENIGEIDDLVFRVTKLYTLSPLDNESITD